jgi:hypothetical protein
MKNNESFSSEALDFFKEEFKEAWSHYRHIEDQRSKYLGISFTIVLGTIGYIAAIAKYFSPYSDLPLIVIAIFPFTTCVFVFLTLLLMALVKCEHLLEFYYRSWNWIRSNVYGSQSQYLIKKLDIRSRSEYIYTSSFFNIQKMLKFLIFIFLLFIFLGQILVLKSAWNQLDSYMRFLSIACLLLILFFSFVAYLLYSKTKPTHSANNIANITSA